MKKLLSQIIAGTAGLWIAAEFISGVAVRVYADTSFFGFGIAAEWQLILVLGIVLGLINFFVGPVIRGATFPLRVLTLGLFDIAINMLLLWFLDLMFYEVAIPWLFPLLYTALIIWLLNLALSKVLTKA